ncbi:hypothetical protein [Streptomyces sp. DHE17-7]|uniref:hypothetical protein n=1 Tax=Streptomyces sp. DHE17-7 TaxID=2759949 RepID=UPI0022EA2A6F|nr:hypothetical protein [Streptomyces sp. DHE17-7]MBJ6623624.1 hypothetical protein [Streptomyces sp. DHE17-7]
MSDHMTVESLIPDNYTHTVRKNSTKAPYTAECGEAAGFPVGKVEPTCPGCRKALGLDSA